MKQFYLIILGILMIFPKANAQSNNEPEALEDGMYALIDTNKGEILTKLFYEQTPITVANFVGLAEGTKEWKQNKEVKTGYPYYDGLVFHRVIADFMIQGGDPTGTGSGGPGYSFPDETMPELLHDKAGILSMANSDGRDKQPYSNQGNTNGSQFFITHKETPWLDGKHTVFGEVLQGQDVVDAIAQGDTMKTIRIIRIGEKANAFVVTQASFEQMVEAYKEKLVSEEIEAEKAIEDAIQKKYPDAEVLDSGLRCILQQEGSGEMPKPNEEITFHFAGSILTLENGELIEEKVETSRDSGVEGRTILGARPMLKGLEEAFYTMKVGELKTIIIPPSLAYIGSPQQQVVSNSTYIVYEIELTGIIKPESQK